ncbi:putative oxidoreductase [Pseudoxanthomonas japonensis]|uniref:aldo/keto reductase n=1 Tax=Pseudoxanthomonas TaxID=83618 RepID=UPI000781B1C4|nr:MULTISPECIES: aldo/keto reductase [Pseudoxanthomonas]MDR7069024.1 putative oxidoreductase [Pseudoxanthomonas japonensis]
MKTYLLADGLPVSRLAYGCMQLSRAWDATPVTADERRLTQRLVETALAGGITLFDHADIYARGKSEQVFGDVLRASPGLRERMVLQSKCGIRFADDPPGTPGRYDFSQAHIVASVEGSLSRLGVGHLDVLLLHRPDALVEPEEVAKAFDTLHTAGKVRHFGVSNHTAGQIALLRRHVRQPLVANQVEVSLLHHHLIDDGVVANTTGHAYASAAGTLDYCRLHDLRMQAWSPLAGGKLATTSEFADPVIRATSALLHQLAEEKGVTPEAIQLAWLLRHPAGIQPIVGTTDPVRLAACCAADGVTLSREEWYALFTAARGTRVP